MTISLLVTLVTALYVIVFTLIHMLKARKRSWVLAVVRLCVTLISILASIPLTRYLAETVTDVIYPILLPRLPEEVTSVLNSVPAGAEGARVLVSLVIAPILYLLAFLVLRWLLCLILLIVRACIPFLRRPSLRRVSMPVGAFDGLLIVMVMLVPLCGYLAFGSHLVDTMKESGVLDSAPVQEALPEDMTAEDVVALSDSFGHHPVVTVVHGTVGNPIFTALTTGELDPTEAHGEVVEINLEDELCGVIVTASHVLDAAEALNKTDYTDADKELLFDAADSLFESDWIRMVAADALVALSESWLENQPFAGIARPSLDSTINPTVTRFLEILATETPETLEEDVHLLLDMVGDLKVHGLLRKNVDYNDMAQKMSQSGLLTDMVEKLEANERLGSMAEELKSLAVRLVSNMLGVEDLQNGEYSEMMGEVADTLTDALSLTEAERDALILDSVKGHFAEQGFDVPDEVTLKMSHHMIEELGADGVITGDELTQYLVDHAEEGFDIVGDEIVGDEIVGGEIPEGQP